MTRDWNKNLWKEWVTIGVVPKYMQAERLEFINEKLIYHIPLVQKY